VRVLLDENLPRNLKRHLPAEIEVVTVRERGWSGKQNGVLLRDTAAEFDAFLTTDQGIPHQQNLSGLDLGVILLRAKSNRLVDLLPLVPQINEALGSIQPGQLIRVSF
jgi:predicted nuclease of predicted toxin-antitoxin system